MATSHQNLSAINSEEVPSAAEMKIGIVVSEWNSQITDGLLKGAKETLLKFGLKEQNLFIESVPGSFELALGAKWLLEAHQLDAVICLGCVIQGETRHFDFVCHGITQGIVQLSQDTGKPVIFGVLTDNNLQQSIDRSGGKHGNKGDEAAVTAIKMVALRKKLIS